MTNHWKSYGRNYYCRYDYDGVDSGAANAVFAHLRSQFTSLTGKKFGGYEVMCMTAVTAVDIAILDDVHMQPRLPRRMSSPTWILSTSLSPRTRASEFSSPTGLESCSACPALPAAGPPSASTLRSTKETPPCCSSFRRSRCRSWWPSRWQ